MPLSTIAALAVLALAWGAEPFFKWLRARVASMQAAATNSVATASDRSTAAGLSTSDAIGSVDPEQDFAALQRLHAMSNAAKQAGHPLGEAAEKACCETLSPLVVQWPVIARGIASENSAPAPSASLAKEALHAVVKHRMPSHQQSGGDA